MLCQIYTYALKLSIDLDNPYSLLFNRKLLLLVCCKFLCHTCVMRQSVFHRVQPFFSTSRYTLLVNYFACLSLISVLNYKLRCNFWFSLVSSLVVWNLAKEAIGKDYLPLAFWNSNRCKQCYLLLLTNFWCLMTMRLLIDAITSLLLYSTWCLCIWALVAELTWW